MNSIGKPERATQDRIITLFREDLHYRYLGDWSDRQGNSNIEDDLLGGYLLKAGYTMAQISRAIYLLRVEADNPKTRENIIKAALLPLLGFDQTKVERIFLILTAQREY